MSCCTTTEAWWIGETCFNVILSTSMSQGFNVNGASSVGVCDGALQPGQLLPSSNIPGHLGVTSLQQCNNCVDLSCCFHPSPGLGSMPPGLPASSPRSFSSTGSLSSLVHNQVGLPSLSQLKQQVDSWNHPAHTPWQTKSWGRVQEYTAVVTNLDFFCSKWARHGWNSFQPQNVSLILFYWNVGAGDAATSPSSADWLPHKASPASTANRLLFTDVDDEWVSWCFPLLWYFGCGYTLLFSHFWRGMPLSVNSVDLCVEAVWWTN